MSRYAKVRRPAGSGSAAAAAILLIGVGLAVAWIFVAPLVLGVAGPGLSGPLPGSADPTQASAMPLMEGVRVSGAFQTTQPRDPFRPLITEDSQAGTGTGTGTGTFTPSGIRVTLVEIREVEGTRRATVTVDATSYDVGEGDTFAGSFQVISLEEDRGVFLFGDNAFELSVGQAILK